jgi:hypothetical protein
MLVEVLKICHTRKTKADHAKMSNARITLANIDYIILDTYNTNGGWVVRKMRSKYVNKIIANFPIIYQKYKV